MKNLMIIGLMVATITVATSDTKVSKKILPVNVTSVDIESNTIPGSSDYVPVTLNETSYTTTENSIATNDSTKINANVFNAKSAVSSDLEKDPLIGKAQSPNPMLSNLPGGINPQVAMVLRNNPRLLMLARQNPIIAQQIMRNPQLLRDPQIQRAIQSQLTPGQSQGLLGQLGQLGLLNTLGRALNPLGIGLNRGNNNGGGAGAGAGLGQYNNNQNNLANQNNGNNFGLPRNQQNLLRNNQHQDTLPGGYYGNNDNYNPQNQNVDQNQNVGDDSTGAGGEDGNAVDGNGNQDYDDSAGGDENAGAENGGEEQQNPAEDPDIQQLQNFGGPVNDNFPEGLFPPGLLSKEDIEEIRKQQERQQQEAAERERQQQLAQQQQHQNQGGEQGGADYDDTGENAGGGEAGEEEAGDGTGSAEDGSGEAVGQDVGQQEQPYQHQQQFTTPLPPAYGNAYQAIQPQRGNLQPLQPGINYVNDGNLVQNPVHHNPVRNQFNYQPQVEYDQGYQQPNPHQQLFTTTFAPPIHSNPVYGSANPLTGYNGFQQQPQPYPPHQPYQPYSPPVGQHHGPHQPWQPPPSRATSSPYDRHSYHGGFPNNRRSLSYIDNTQPPPPPPQSHFGAPVPGSVNFPNNQRNRFQQRPNSFGL